MTIKCIWQEAKAFFNRDKPIIKQVKRDKNIIYGARAIKAQIGGAFARPTKDYDILSNAPKRSAHQLQKKLDSTAGGDYYYATPSKVHPTTKKVYHVGKDMKKRTKDDIGIADFTKPERNYRTVNIKGVKYVHLSEVKKDKRKALADKEFEFRHAKDQEDLNRMKAAKYKFK